MSRLGRRKPATPVIESSEEEEWPGEERFVAASSRGPAIPAEPMPSNRLRGNEITYGYIVGGIIAVAGIIMLVVTTGKGAPTHPQPIWAALGVVLGLATVLTIRFSNRMLTSLVAIAGGFVSGQAKTPSSLSGVKIVALLAPVVYGMLIFRRQSKADRVLRASRPRQSPAERRAGRARGRNAGATKDEPVPGRPKASGRYTPPKAKTPPAKGSRTKR